MSIPLEPIRKIQAATAREVCTRVTLSSVAQSYLTPLLSPQGFLSVLDRDGHFPDAIRFLAFSLPVREGVWWSCMVGLAVPEALSTDPDPCYTAAQNWVYEPHEENRFACLAAAEIVGCTTSGAYAALGAFWSGGSMAPPGMPDVLPDPILAPTGIAASVLLAVAASDPKQAATLHRRALRQGLEIGNGGEGRLDATDSRAGTGAFR